MPRRCHAGGRLVLLVWLLALRPAIAQSEDEFDRIVEQADRQFAEAEERADRQFADFLERAWKQFDLLEGVIQDSVPKPHVAPAVPPGGKASKQSPPVTPLVTPKSPAPEPPSPSLPYEPPSVLPRLVRTSCQFYGDDLEIIYDPTMVASNPLRQVDQRRVSAAWTGLSRAAYQPFLNRLGSLRDSLALGDWGCVQLAGQAAAAMCPNDANQRALLTWFTLCKMGYRTRVGCENGTVYLLVATTDDLYGIPYVRLDDCAYYAVDFAGQAQPVKRLSTYDGEYPGPLRAVDLRRSPPPALAAARTSRTFVFVYQGVTRRLAVPLDANPVHYLARFPHTEFAVYFAGPPSPAVSAALLEGLRPLVRGLSAPQAANLLLCFVQTAFEYQTDEQQFGRERPLFPEETLYYPYSDCEDRAALFAWLVRSLLGLPVIGLHYPGHVATAVQFPTAVSGAAVMYEGGRYTVCDPTYINSTIGMAMPQFIGVAPKAIEVAF